MGIDIVITQDGIQTGGFDEEPEEEFDANDEFDCSDDEDDPVERLKMLFPFAEEGEKADVVNDLKSLVRSGDWDACAWLALCYSAGFGVPMDAFVADSLLELCELKGSKEKLEVDEFVEEIQRQLKYIEKRKSDRDFQRACSIRREKGICGFCSDYTVIDIETTGFSRELDEITELAALRIRDNKIVSRFQELVRVKKTIPEVVVEKTHITNEMLKDARPLKDVLADFLAFIGDDALVGYNIDRFDVPFIDCKDEQCFCKHLTNRTIDIWSLAKKLLPGLGNYKLDSIREVLGISSDGAHRALKDCMDTYAVYSKLASDNREPEMNVDKVESRMPSHKPISTCGEFRVNIPQGYRPKLKVSIPTHYKDRWEYVKECPFTTFASSNVVVTGDGPSFGRAHAEEVLTALGANVLKTARRDCDFCIVLENPGQGKIRAAQKLEGQGSAIRILDLDDFKRMIEASLEECDED